MRYKMKSNWLEVQVELMKAIQGYERKDPRRKVGDIDYVNGDGEEKKLLRVIFPRARSKSKADTGTIHDMIAFMDGEGYDEAIIIAEEFTYGAINLIRDTENLDYISEEARTPFSLAEILYAMQKKTFELCESFCGKAPTTEDECKGHRNGKYSCAVRRISDDADFHYERSWLRLLLNDFYELVNIKEETNKFGGKG